MKNIVLIGMSGAGKSTVGVILAKALGLSFIDTDIIIQNNEGMRLQDIIENRGTKCFLELEEKHLLTLSVEGTVIATGGSAVFSTQAMKKLKENGDIIYLKVDYPEIERRVKNFSTRGVVKRREQSLSEVYSERVELYEKYADIIVEATNTDIESTVKEIIRTLSCQRYQR